MTKNPLKNIVILQKDGKAVGIYSCCSANRFVLEAAIKRAKQDNSPVLIEATANQVNQYGGYTGMTAKDFMEFVHGICRKYDFPVDNLFIGGDHLGPLTFTDLNEEEALKEAATLIKDYVKAGFTKIHIDTSMKVASDDPDERLSDAVIARRGAYLAKEANEAYEELLKENPEATEIVYVIGSEVPIPGGAQGKNSTELEVTKVEDLNNTIDEFRKAFENEGISDLFDNVIGIVVQPGIEEQDAGCVEYDRHKASELMQEIKKIDGLVFEGHSSDYQTKYKLRELVEDGVGILKVGPGLTYAAREGLFALANIEKELFKNTDVITSNFIEVLEKVMLENPGKWEKYYKGNENEQYIKRKYSFSDRSRYYMPNKDVEEAVKLMMNNLTEKGIPLSLLSQFMPIQYTKVREGLLANDPEQLVVDRVINTIDEYLFATNQKELLK